MIKKYKSKCKVLENEYAKLKASNNELLIRHNEVVELMIHVLFLVSNLERSMTSYLLSTMN